MSSVYVPVPASIGSITLPSDGDSRSAASVNVPIQALADGVAFNKAATVSNAAAIVAIKANIFLADIRTATGTSLDVNLANGGVLTQTVTLLSNVVPTIVGDVVEVLLSSTMGFISQGTPNALEVSVKLRANQNGVGLVDIAGAATSFKINSNPTNESLPYIPFNVAGVFTVTTAGTLGVSVLAAIVTSSVGDQVASVGPSTAVYRVWRTLP